MKWKPFLTEFLLIAFLLGWALPAPAASRYTDKVNALDLAEILDKGAYRDRLITSTFIQSVGKGRYQIKVVLDNGAEHTWNLDQLRALARREQIVLSSNRALLFPTQENNLFVSLDKAEFSRKALRSKVFVKHYPPSDVLAGQKLNFGIHRFNLVDLLGIRPGKDAQGYRYHYIIDLENGQREFLSYLDAYYVMARGALVEDPASVDSFVRAPYRVEGIEPIPLQPLSETGKGTFGFEIIYDRPVALTPGHFPFRFIENGNGAGRRSDFLVEITSPNSELRAPVTPIDSVEFLRHIHVVPDRGKDVRLVFRAGISPSLMDSPPEVKVEGSRVLIMFTKVVDQSVVDMKARAKEELRVRQDRLLHRTLTEDEVARRVAYKERMKSGGAQQDQARHAKPFRVKFDTMMSAADAFRQAATHASTDLDLQLALRARNEILAKLPTLVVAHVRKTIRAGVGAEAGELRELLDQSALMTRDRQMLRTIQRLFEDPALR